MTRQFNKQPRDDSRPPSRNIPSSRYEEEEEQSSRPARPRLNRAMVDRGWENGTPRHHADYHPRTSNGQAPYNQGRRNQQAGYSSYNGPTGNRTNGNRQSQSNYNSQAQRSGPSSQSYSTPRKRPFDSRGSNAEDRRFNNQRGDEPYGYNNRQAQNNQRPPQGRGSNFRTQEHNQGRSNGYGNNRPQPNREHSSGYGNNRPQRNPERDRGRGYTSFNERSTYDNQEQREQHPRLQSRPEAFQRQQGDRRPKNTPRSAPHQEQFKGDYEHFSYDTPAEAEAATRKPFRGNRPNRYESHPNNRPRLVQHKDAEFRASIDEDAEELINRVHSSPDEHSKVREETASLPEMTTENSASENLPPAFPDKQTEPSPVNKQTKRATNVGKTKKTEVEQSPSRGPRPSQRGYKWPKS